MTPQTQESHPLRSLFGFLFVSSPFLARRPMYHFSMALVQVDVVSKSYPRRAGLRTELRTVVDTVSFEIVAGETLGLVGESGSGKTTVARMILGLVPPSSGSICIQGIDVAQASRPKLKASAAQMQPVFQDPYAAPQSAHEGLRHRH